MNPIIEFYAVKRCASCDAESGSNQRDVCERCALELENSRFSDSNRCPVCFHTLSRGNCQYCSSRNIFFDRHISLYPLSGKRRLILHRWKFENQRSIYKSFLVPLRESIKKFSVNIDRIGYIDSGKSLYQTRNYQPCADLTRELSFHYSVQSGGDLTKKKKDKQSGRDYLERFVSNLNGFEVKNSLQGLENYLLLEDIFTTGSTANEAARLLKKRGVKKVLILSVFFREQIEE